MPSIRLATDEQRQAYNGIYPLHGLIRLDGRDCTLEDLREWPQGDPHWELLAPKGYHFFPDGTHTRLAWTQADLLEWMRSASLEPCDPDSHECRAWRHGDDD